MRTDRDPYRRAVRYTQVAGVIALALGALGLIGWVADVPILLTLRPTWPRLMPISATAYVLLGTSLLGLSALQHTSSAADRRLRSMIAVLGAALAMAGLLTLAEYLFGWQAGFDRWLFPAAVVHGGGTHPGRMSPDTAISVTLLGVAIALSALRSLGTAVTAITLGSAICALTLGLASFSVRATPSLGDESWLGATGMSMPSALVLTAAGAALFLYHLQRRRGLWVLGIGTAHAFGIAIVLMFVTGLTTSRLQHRIGDLGDDIAELDASRMQLHALLESVSRAQSALAAVASAGDTRQSRAILDARTEADSLLRLLDTSRLQALAPGHADHLILLRGSLALQRAWQDSVLRSARREFSADQRRMVMQRGFALAQRVSETVHDVERAHVQESAVLDAERADAERRAYQVILATTLTSVAILTVMLLGLNRTERSRQEAHARLLASEFRWKFAIEGAGDGLWDADLTTGKVYYSRQWKRMLGYDEHEIGDTEEEWSSRLHEDDRDAALQARDEAMRLGAAPYHSEHRLRCRDGEWLRVLARGVIVDRDASGRPLRAIGTMTDITARHRMERALAESESRFRNLIERAQQAIFIHRHGAILYVNPAAVEMMRSGSAEALVGTRLLDRVHPESRDLVAERVRKAAADGATAPLAVERLMRCDGTDFYAEVVGTVTVFDGELAMFASASDITARRETEAALRSSEARFHTVFHDAPLGIAVVDSDSGEVLEVNAQAVAMTGWPREKLLGRDWKLITHPDDLEKNLRLIAELRAGETDHYQLDKRFLRPDGSIVWVRLTGARLSTDAGLGTRHVAMMEDITKLRNEEQAREQLEMQLQASQRMESVGRLAGGVAHDFNNMLGVILGTTEMAMRRLKPNDPLLGDLREVQGAARRSADLTRQLLAFARRQVVAPTVMDINAAVSSSLSMLQRLIGEDVTLEWRGGSGVWPVVADETQFDQILTNLVLNARHAINGVGTITITTENRVLDAAFCDAHADAIPGEYSCLSVSDTGQGMSADVLAHIFEPFFTTKAVGEGTGLGLATVYGAVRQNQGCIAVDSAPGQGATFDIYFPRHRAEPVATPQPGGGPTRARGTERILVVEDEPTIMRMTVRMLESEGYEAQGLSNPREAAALDAARLASFDLLLTDVVMPGLNGRELAANLCARSPRLKVLFMSGHPSDVMQQHGIVADGVHFIQKPFITSVIAAKVRETLDESAGA